ncbi:hypothetical protein [Terrisporobacter petrolearius]|uniref:hypothetical protein n=1 Tax=Terrisporobacter petrolearius TaxID=1460447 RepID=UPI0022E69931|nr:hypothetical protein [Terrisporobacter petrolearius]
MEAIIERCVGLDVHLDTVVACVLYGELDKKPFLITKGILQLLDYLKLNQCTHVAMQSIGVYWKPVWNLLECGDRSFAIYIYYFLYKNINYE